VRILANENVSGEIVQSLRAQGHDIIWMRIEAPGSTDSEVLALAQTEKRIIMTFDKDFGELAFRWGLPVTSGIILLRLIASSPIQLQQAVLTALGSRQEQDWIGMFSVVEASRIRVTPLPVSQ
jgi:predicted nuclease of predicted toxin-antitoxin system